jgi:hypothetical protein
VTLLSWRPVNFDRWLGLAGATSGTATVQASNLVAAIERMRLSWDRLRGDLGELFVPSGPPGTHAYYHFHAPADLGARERALGACAADYETFLVYLEIALQLSTRCISGPAGLAMQNWKTLAEAAARGDPGLATDARDQILTCRGQCFTPATRVSCIRATISPWFPSTTSATSPSGGWHRNPTTPCWPSWTRCCTRSGRKSARMPRSAVTFRST